MSVNVFVQQKKISRRRVNKRLSKAFEKGDRVLGTVYNKKHIEACYIFSTILIQEHEKILIRFRKNKRELIGR